MASLTNQRNVMREATEPPCIPAPSSEPGERSPFLADIHRVRGMAILLIVATHCMYVFQWETHPWAEKFLLDLLDDSTVIFVFVSGYLFKHGSARFSYSHYIERKLKNVIAPFLLISIPAIAFFLWSDAQGREATYIHDLSLPSKVLHLYLYPGMHGDFALWFIPVVVIYYVCAPALLWVSNRSLGVASLFVLVPLSVLMHRPSYHHGHNLALAVYFLSAYVLGMISCRYRDRVSVLIDSNLVAFASAFLLLLVGHVLLSTHHGKYQVFSFTDIRQGGTIDWIYVQKLLLIPVLLGFARRGRSLQLRWLDYLADVSFTVFFLHLYVIWIFASAVHWRRYEVNWLTYPALMVAAVLVPCAVATLVRRLVPNWSRSLVGS